MDNEDIVYLVFGGVEVPSSTIFFFASVVVVRLLDGLFVLLQFRDIFFGLFDVIAVLLRYYTLCCNMSDLSSNVDKRGKFCGTIGIQSHVRTNENLPPALQITGEHGI